MHARRRKCETVGSKSHGSAHLHCNTVIFLLLPTVLPEGQAGRGLGGVMQAGLPGSHVEIACC